MNAECEQVKLTKATRKPRRRRMKIVTKAEFDKFIASYPGEVTAGAPDPVDGFRWYWCGDNVVGLSGLNESGAAYYQHVPD